ncbi:TPA: RNA polymerase factor sigma-70, partial [Burkholderia territorii]|nr:RNA polymerase factor sigma-70 [Burkholderia territorii]
MAMAEVLERPAAATANPFLGKVPDRRSRPAPRVRRTAEAHAQGALLDVLVSHRAMLVNVARGF